MNSRSATPQQTSMPLRGVAVIGTRPEAIKVAPVVLAARKEPTVEIQLISTGQHQEVHDQVLELFGLKPDMRLDVMEHRQSLGRLSARCLIELEAALAETMPDVALVQGDTTTAAMAALAAFYAAIPVWHIEAGLRTSTPDLPFPEEMNRRLISRLASFHLAATDTGRRNLLREGVPEEAIAVTGNTGIDALHAALELRREFKDPVLRSTTAGGGPLLVVTAHRRENWGPGIRSVAAATRELLDAFPNLTVVHAVHPNPTVRADVEAGLGGHPRAAIVDPVDYGDFVQLLARATVIVTDSGGIQEEAPSLGVPVIVTRAETERVESIQAGLSVVVSTAREEIVSAVTNVLEHPDAWPGLRGGTNPYGDGRAAERILDLLVERLRGPTSGDACDGSSVTAIPGLAVTRSASFSRLL